MLESDLHGSSYLKTVAYKRGRGKEERKEVVNINSLKLISEAKDLLFIYEKISKTNLYVHCF